MHWLDPCLCVWCVKRAFCFVASLEMQGQLFGMEPGVGHPLQACLLLKDAQAGPLRGHGATRQLSLCPAWKPASGPFQAIVQMATLCFLCAILSIQECYIEKESICLCHVSKVKNVKEKLGNLIELLDVVFVNTF